MTKKRKRNSTYLVAFAGILLATFIIYSCSTDSYEMTNEQGAEKVGMEQSHGFSLKTRGVDDTLIDSIAASDEFWEFEMSTELLADKFEAYTSTLNEKQYEELMNHINDDDYMEEVMRNADMEKELQQLDTASKNLFQRTGFLRLSKEEQSQLFLMYAESAALAKPNLLKTREESGNTSACEKRKEEAINKAKKEYDEAIVECNSSSSSLVICCAQASAKYDRDKRKANKEYEECIQISN